MDIVELQEKTTLAREDAAARLHAIADELASGNDIVMERDHLRFVARVPDEVHMKIDWTRSPKLEVDVPEQGDVHLTCAANAKPYTVLWYISFGLRNYVRLEHGRPAAA